MDVPVLGVSPNGEYLALSCLDGTLKIWDANTGSLNQEYVPSSHLSSTCTCLSWGSKVAVSCGAESGTPGSARKKKKRRSGGLEETCEMIALGTTTGNLLLYNTIKGDIHAQLSEGHHEKVNSVCWSEDGSTLYSCADDRYIAEWCLSKNTPKRRWKADENPVHCVAVMKGSKHLLSASREIKLWNLENKEVMKTFTGHSSEVHWLIPVGIHTVQESSNHQTYFLSATAEDRHINVWETGSTNTKSALASFMLQEEPAHIHIAPPNGEGRPFMLLVITKSGMLQVFVHTLNGRIKKPLKPKVCVQIVSETKSRESNPHRIPVLSAHVCDDRDHEERQIMLTFGTSLKPVFEKIPYSTLEKETVLVREDPSAIKLRSSDPASRIKPTEVPKDVTVLAPGHMAPNAPSVSIDGKSKSKRKKSKPEDMTMEERLHALGVDKPAGSKKSLPKTDTLCTLLAQGLQSQDKKILSHVLQNTDNTLIHNTVKKLPVPVIVPLVMELTKRMHGHAQSAQLLIKWVKAVLTLHTSYLMSFPELIESFSSLYQMMENRVKAFGQLSRLQGKLNLMLSQVSSKGREEEGDTAAGQQPLLLYQDESSDNEMEMDQDDFAPDSSESDDNWEELSDMDQDTPQNGHPEEDEDDDEDG